MTTIRECIVNAADILDQRENVVACVQYPDDSYEQKADELLDRADDLIKQALGMEPTTLEEAKDLLACVAWHTTEPDPEHETHVPMDTIVSARYHPGYCFEAIAKRPTG